MKTNAHMFMTTAVVLAFFVGLSAATPRPHRVVVHPQTFEAGGWKCDVQFMDVMGSPYLLAHGLGVPVPDAKASVAIPEAGTWRVRVRTRNWWDGSPGAFKVVVNGRLLERTFGVGAMEWGWENGGEVELPAGAVEVRLRDLTGFDGRCAGVVFEKGEGLTPLDGAVSIAEDPVAETLETEFCIVGGGLPGCAAAVAAARGGVKTVLLQDRPYFGGNASEEVRVWSAGEGMSQPIVAELRGHYTNMEKGTVKDDARRQAVLDREANLSPLGCCRVFAVEKNPDGSIAAVKALDWKRNRVIRVKAKLFLDATGDGWLGYYAGADYRMGREAKSEYNETRYAPDKADGDTLGASLMWTSQLGNVEVPFSATWAEPSARGIAALHGDWDWEYGVHRDMIREGEHVRDRLLAAIYGCFSLAKRSPANSRYVLDFVPFILGKRESRRLLGDYVFCEKDEVERTPHADAIAKTSWSVDLHYDDKIAGVDYQTTCRQPIFGRAFVPFRSIYSRNVPNLMMAGRCFSCSHVGLASPRVMNTLAQMGVAAGYAAVIAKRDGISPREIYRAGKVREIQRMMGGDWPGNPDPARKGWTIVDDEDGRVRFGAGWSRQWLHNGEQWGDVMHQCGPGAAEAEFPLDVAKEGRYVIRFRVPFCPWPREGVGGEVAYEVRSGGTTNKVWTSIQSAYGRWRKLGEFTLAPGAVLAIVPKASTTRKILADAFAVEGPRTDRSDANGNAMERLLASYVDAGRIAGVVSVLSDADYRTQFDCVGWADVENKVPMKPDTLFAICSMSKTFLGAALMCAIDEGRLSLDDKVSKYFPEYASLKLPGWENNGREVTLRDLGCHTDGLRRQIPFSKNTLTLQEAARWYANQPLVSVPGWTFSYGSMRFSVLGAVLEKATGEHYEDYLKRKILDPLGMKDTTFNPNAEQRARLIRAYTSDGGPVRPAKDELTTYFANLKPTPDPVEPAPGSGMFSTPADMIRFSQMLAHHGEWKGKRIISRKTFDGVFAVKQTPPPIGRPYSVGAWLYGDWFGHEGALRTDQRANLKTGHSRVFFIQTENRAGKAFFELKADWHRAADRMQGTSETVFGD